MKNYNLTESKHSFENIMEKEISRGDITVRYSLYKSNCDETGAEVYSIATTTFNKGSVEPCIAFDISRSIDRAQNIYDVISSGFVTSCTLRDILEDIL